jgi:hypothetical protein
MNCRECGTPLRAGGAEVGAPTDPAVENPRRASGEKLMRQGMIWFVGGSAVTLFSYMAAVSSPYGGHYVITYGAIVFGAAQYFRGRAAASGTDTNDQAQELLDVAARLESVDRAKAEELYAEIARKFPGTRAGKEAERNMQTLASHRE